MEMCVCVCKYVHYDKFFIDLPTVISIRNVSEICVASFNISWNISTSMTCGVVSYEVSISPPPVEGNAIATTDNMFYSVTGLNNSLPNVTITVTVSNREGQENNRTFFVELPNPRGTYLCKCMLVHIHTHTHTVCTYY